MLRLTPEQRRLLADKVLDAANLAIGGLVFAQFVTGGSFSWGSALLGLGLWALFTSVAVGLLAGKAAS